MTPDIRSLLKRAGPLPLAPNPKEIWHKGRKLKARRAAMVSLGVVGALVATMFVASVYVGARPPGGGGVSAGPRASEKANELNCVGKEIVTGISYGDGLYPSPEDALEATWEDYESTIPVDGFEREGDGNSVLFILRVEDSIRATAVAQANAEGWTIAATRVCAELLPD